MQLRRELVYADGPFALVDWEGECRHMTEGDLQQAKWQASRVWQRCEGEIKSKMRRSLCRGRCKPSSVVFKKTASQLRRLRTAKLVDLGEGLWGETEKGEIRINKCAMTYECLVNTLVHEALHDCCLVRGRVPGCEHEHRIMRSLGEERL